MSCSNNQMWMMKIWAIQGESCDLGGAIEYKFNKQASLARYNPYQLLYGREPIFPSVMKEKIDPIMNLNDLKTWVSELHD